MSAGEYDLNRTNLCSIARDGEGGFEREQSAELRGAEVLREGVSDVGADRVGIDGAIVLVVENKRDLGGPPRVVEAGGYDFDTASAAGGLYGIESWGGGGDGG